MTINPATYQQLSPTPPSAPEGVMITKVMLGGKMCEVWAKLEIAPGKYAETLPAEVIEKATAYVQNLLALHKANGLESHMQASNIQSIRSNGIILQSGRILSHELVFEQVKTRLSPEKASELTNFFTTSGLDTSSFKATHIWNKLETLILGTFTSSKKEHDLQLQIYNKKKNNQPLTDDELKKEQQLLEEYFKEKSTLSFEEYLNNKIKN